MAHAGAGCHIDKTFKFSRLGCNPQRALSKIFTLAFPPVFLPGQFVASGPRALRESAGLGS